MDDNATKCTHMPEDSEVQNTGNVQSDNNRSSATAPPETTQKKEGASPTGNKATPPAKIEAAAVDELSGLSDEARGKINEILRDAGITVTVEGICTEIKKLEEENRHTKEICNMLTRFRFCPHSEQKRMLFRMTKDFVKIVDDMNLVTPELEGVPEEILNKIRSGEIELVTDEHGNLHVPPMDKATGTTSTCGTGSDNGEGAAGNGDGSNSSGSDGGGKDGTSGDDTGGGDTHGSPKSHHARRTKGSLDRKFQNVEHRKCYMAFEDDKGCKDNPPLDEDGYPMIYIGEKPVRQILVRIPEHYVMYECYTQRFRRMTQEERSGKPGPDIPDPDETEDFKTRTLEGNEVIDGVVLEVTEFEAESFMDELDEDIEDFSEEDLEELEYIFDDGTASEQNEGSLYADVADAEEQKGLAADSTEENDRATDRREESTDTTSVHAVLDEEDAEKHAYGSDGAHSDGLLPEVLLEEQCMETVDPGTEIHPLHGKEGTCSLDGLHTVHDPPG